MKHFPELQLSAAGARVLGCLLEKEVTTPDLYPLTLNSLVTACNQASSRHPITNYSADEVQAAVTELSEDYLVTKVLGGRAPKYEHELGDVLHLDDRERAILTVLLLRGTQTAGELKQRSERLFAFDTLPEVEEVLSGFIEYSHGPLVARISAGGGRRVETFRHLLAEESASLEVENSQSEATPPQDLVRRVEELEAEVASLRSQLDSLLARDSASS